MVCKREPVALKFKIFNATGSFLPLEWFITKFVDMMVLTEICWYVIIKFGNDLYYKNNVKKIIRMLLFFENNVVANGKVRRNKVSREKSRNLSIGKLWM